MIEVASVEDFATDRSALRTPLVPTEVLKLIPSLDQKSRCEDTVIVPSGARVPTMEEHPAASKGIKRSDFIVFVSWQCVTLGPSSIYPYPSQVG